MRVTPIADDLTQVWPTPTHSTATLPTAGIRVTSNVGDSTVLVDGRPQDTSIEMTSNLRQIHHYA